MADTPSPTGTPVLPPKYVPVLLVVLAGVNAALLALTQGDFPPSVKLVAQVLLATLGPVLAALSPGLRKPDGSGGAPLAKALGAAGSVTTGGSGSALSREYAGRQLARTKLLGVVGALGLVAFPAGARAASLLDAFDYGMGPSIPLLQFPLGVKSAPVQFAPGTGVQFNATPKALQFEWAGKKWDLVSGNVFLFGSLVTGTGGQPLGQLSVAGGLALLSSAVGVAIGTPVLSEGGILFPGKPFLLLALNLNILLNPPASASLGGLPRANALYF